MNRHVLALAIGILAIWSTAFAGSVPLAAPGKEEITSVSLSRTPCEGPCPVDKVILRSDGTATYYPDRSHPDKSIAAARQLTGIFAKAEFGQLADLLLAHKFFSLKDNYTVGMTCQPSHIITVVYGSKRKKVDDYGVRGPQELRKIETAIRGITANIKWETDEHSIYLDEPPGIRGTARQLAVAASNQQSPSPARPVASALIVVKRASDGREVASQRTGIDGKFAFSLPPGQYRLVPLPDEQIGLLRAGEQLIVVKPAEFADVVVGYRTEAR